MKPGAGQRFGGVRPLSLPTDRPTAMQNQAAPAVFSLPVAVLGFFVITLDAVVVGVALPSIRRDLGGSTAAPMDHRPPCRTR
jgi:hypothetical protein